MQSFEFHNPVKIIFGKETLSRIGQETAAYGKKVLLVYGQNSIKANGIYNKAITSLDQAGVEIVEFAGVRANPVLSHLKAGIELARKHNVQAIVAIGGGSVLDESKAIAAGVPYDGDVWDFFVNRAEVKEALPVLTVLTLAATGSEMNPTGVVTNEESFQKFEISGPPLYPKVSVLDPTTLYTVPPAYTAYAAVDAISHVVEGYFTGDDPHTPLQDRLVENIICSVMESCEACLDNPEDLDARSTFMWAACLALNGLPWCGIGNFGFPNHMIEHSLSALYDVAHGAGLSIVMPGWMTFAAKEDPRKFARFADSVFNIDEGTPEARAEAGIGALRAWFEKIGSPVTLSQADIPETDIPKIAENAVMLARKWEMAAYDKARIIKILESCR